MLGNQRDLNQLARLLDLPIEHVYESLDGAAVHVFQEKTDAALLEKGSVAAEQVLVSKGLNHFEFVV